MATITSESEESEFSSNRSLSMNERDPELIVTTSVSRMSMTIQNGQNLITQRLSSQLQIRDESEVFSVSMILTALYVATFCGLAAFILHVGVYFAGCISGVNGCADSVLLDLVGIRTSVYFIIMSGLSGLICSLIIYSPFRNGVLKNCKGGGSAGTKITVSAGKRVSAWVAVFRIILCMLYLGGGNTLGTEGPIIHLSSSFATFLVSVLGIESRKSLSIFAVVGAAAGISAGFNVLVTGIVFVIEELTRTLRPKVSLMIALAAAWAVFVKHKAEVLLEMYVHVEHVKLTPKGDVLKKLTESEANICLLLCIPIGIINGIAGWLFAQLAWRIQVFLNEGFHGKMHLLSNKLHLLIIGLINGAIGALVYEITNVNGVWGTNVGQVPEAVKAVVKSKLPWYEALILFVGKLFAFILATAGGGPGGTLVPALVAGGFMGVVVGALFDGGDGGESLISTTAVVGMGSLFASVMHMPVTGVVIIFELTHADNIMMHIVLANFISANVCARLPHGEHSYVHICLHHDPVWQKLGGQDFIETDDHEQRAHNSVGHGRLSSMCSMEQASFWRGSPDLVKMKVFNSWHVLSTTPLTFEEAYAERVSRSHDKVCERMLYLDKAALVFASLCWWRRACAQKGSFIENGTDDLRKNGNGYVDDVRSDSNDLLELPFPRRPPDVQKRGSQGVWNSKMLDV